MKKISKQTINSFLEVLGAVDTKRPSSEFIDLKIDHDIITFTIKKYIVDNNIKEYPCIFYSGSYAKGTQGLFSDVDVFFISMSEGKYYTREFTLINGIMFELNFITTSYLMSRDMTALTKAKLKNTFIKFKFITDDTSGIGRKIIDEFMSSELVFDVEKTNESQLFGMSLFIMDMCNPVDKSDYLLSATLLLNYYMGFMVWYYTGDITRSFKLLDRDPVKKNKDHPYFKITCDKFTESILTDDPNIFIEEVCAGFKRMGYNLPYHYKDTHTLD